RGGAAASGPSVCPRGRTGNRREGDEPDDDDDAADQQASHVQDGGHHATDAARVRAALALGVHASFTDLLHVVVAEDPGDRPEDPADAVRQQGEDAQDEDQGAAVLGVAAPAAAAAASVLRLVVVVVIPGRPAAGGGRRFVFLDHGGSRRAARGRL